MTSKIKRYLLAIIIITISTQIYIDVLIGDFRVSGGVIAFAIIMYFFRDINALILGLVVSLTTYLWRVSLFMVTHEGGLEVLDGFAPEIMFYLLYCIVFWYLSKKNTVEDLKHYFLVIMMADLSANVIEIIIHYLVFDRTLSLNIGLVLPLVAILRSSVVFVSLKGSKYYQLLVLVEEQQDRYNKLVWLSMNLKSEVYWMAKNMDKIDETMTHAYKLFENIQANREPEMWAQHSVEIAGDVHEIKKDYELIMRGVTEITEFRFQDKGMWFEDLMDLVEKKIQREVDKKERPIDFNLSLGKNFYTDKHYQLMSIFRNLFMNGIDAIGSKDGPRRIDFIHDELSDSHIFAIQDTGSGIGQEDLEAIFRPGYSTKINYDTGEVNRGIGLSFVKDVIERSMGGTIKVTSTQGVGTCFEIIISKEILEV